MGMWTSRVDLVFNFSHIVIASFSEFVIDGHYFTSPNQQKPPPAVSFSDSESLPYDVSPSQLLRRVWARLSSTSCHLYLIRWDLPVSSSKLPLESSCNSISASHGGCPIYLRTRRISLTLHRKDRLYWIRRLDTTTEDSELVFQWTSAVRCVFW
jgi:hypothetical protein